MMSLLIFYSMMFGLFGVVTAQYTTIYKNAYEIWVHHNAFIRIDPDDKNPEICVKNLDPKTPRNKKVQLCNKGICGQVESLSRQICRVNTLYFTVIYSLYFTAAIIFIVLAIDAKSISQVYHFKVIDIINFAIVNETNIVQYQNYVECLGSLGLTAMLTVSATLLVFSLGIKSNRQKSIEIDKKLFEVWWKFKCHRYKSKDLQENMQPRRLYEILAEEIHNGNVTDATQDEIKLVKDLHKIWIFDYSAQP